MSRRAAIALLLSTTLAAGVLPQGAVAQVDHVQADQVQSDHVQADLGEEREAADAANARRFEALEAAGARIGEVHIVVDNIFDTDDPREDKLLYRWANALHIRTRPQVIRHALPFKRGDAVSALRMAEAERLLRSNRYLYDVRIQPLEERDGVVDIEVRTRDTWSLDPGFSAGRSGGVNSSGWRLREYNLLGTGVSLGFGRSNSVDRSSSEFTLSADRVFGSRANIDLSTARNSDGRRDAASIVRPFYALDSRWTAGVTLLHDDRVDDVYRAGKTVSEFRHRLRQAELFAGWSAGRVDGWVQRYTLGLSSSDDRYAPEPGQVAPPLLPDDERLVGPFLRYDLIEERVERLHNRNQMERPEFFSMGLLASLGLGWAGRGFGASRDALLYSATLSRGFEPAPGQTLTLSGSINGRLAGGRLERQTVGAQAQYFLPQTPRWLFYAAASAEVLSRPQPTQTLLLGGDSGLRGYPLRYQDGQRRVLLTVEERFFTDIYLWRLFRVGGALFADAGRAWGGNASNLADPGWLGDVGAGLRIVSTRTSFGNVLHIDIARPLRPRGDVKSLQFLVRTKVSF